MHSLIQERKLINNAGVMIETGISTVELLIRSRVSSGRGVYYGF